MKSILGFVVLLASVVLLAETRAGDTKDAKDTKDDTIRYSVTALELSEEFARFPEKATKKYRPMKPFLASINLRANVARMLGKDFLLTNDSDVQIIARAKKIDGKLEGPTTLLAKDGRFVEFRANAVILEFATVKLVPIKE